MIGQFLFYHIQSTQPWHSQGVYQSLWYNKNCNAEIITRETLKNVSLWLSFPECGRLYPVLLSDQKEGALQTAVPKT